MTFAISAALPLGTYRGAEMDGRAECLPSVSRLFSALLCAAGFGPRAQADGDGLRPCDADTVLLRWLEDNPPDAVSVPALQVNRGRAVAFRDDGTLKKAKAVISVKKLPKAPDASVAVQGVFRWIWEQDPPAQVAGALVELCSDVPYLGTSESPVRLTAGPVPSGDATVPDALRATHRLDPGAGLFDAAGGLDVEVPMPGRLQVLTTVHEAALAQPAQRQDAFGTDEQSLSAVPSREAVAVARYTSVEVPAPVGLPWSRVLLLPLEQSVPVRDRVRFAVTIHRALIAAVGVGVPPLITGVYGTGRRPANGLALHLLDDSMPVDLRGHPAAVALLIPVAAEASDLEVLGRAVQTITSLRGPGGENVRVAGPPWVVSGDRLWNASVVPGARTWQSEVPVVPDTRGGRGTSWTFADAALLSLGFVWKERLGRIEGRAEQRDRAIVARVLDLGVEVIEASPLRTSETDRYVHKVNSHAVVRPYRCRLDLGGLGGDRAVVAIGQSRHFGGGLLVPVDLAADPAAPVSATSSQGRG